MYTIYTHIHTHTHTHTTHNIHNTHTTYTQLTLFYIGTKEQKARLLGHLVKEMVVVFKQNIIHIAVVQSFVPLVESTVNALMLIVNA